MLNYEKLKDKPRAFLAATGRTLEEFLTLLLALQSAYEKRYPSDRTREGQPRQRRAGGGAQGGLQSYPESPAKCTTRKPPIRRKAPIPSTPRSTRIPAFKAMSPQAS